MCRGWAPAVVLSERATISVGSEWSCKKSHLPTLVFQMSSSAERIMKIRDIALGGMETTCSKLENKKYKKAFQVVYLSFLATLTLVSVCLDRHPSTSLCIHAYPRLCWRLHQEGGGKGSAFLDESTLLCVSVVWFGAAVLIDEGSSAFSHQVTKNSSRLPPPRASALIGRPWE